MLSTQLTAQLLQLSRDEVSEVYDVLKHRNHSLVQQEKSAFSVGDEVYFISSKGVRIEGAIVKMMPTNIRMKTNKGGTAKVHPSFLNHVVKSFNPLTGMVE